MNNVTTVATSIPPIITSPSGVHMLLFFMVRGSNPPFVVKDVRTMGVKRILAALAMASRISEPFCTNRLALHNNAPATRLARYTLPE